MWLENLIDYFLWFTLNVYMTVGVSRMPLNLENLTYGKEQTDISNKTNKLTFADNKK